MSSWYNRNGFCFGDGRGFKMSIGPVCTVITIRSVLRKKDLHFSIRDSFAKFASQAKTHVNFLLPYTIDLSA